MAVDRADRDLIEMREHVERAAYQSRPTLAELAHAPASLGRIHGSAGRSFEHRFVRARAKRGAFAGHDKHAAIAVVADRMQVTLELEDDGLVEAVTALRPVESDCRNRTVMIDEEVFRHARNSTLSVRLVNRSLQ